MCFRNLVFFDCDSTNVTFAFGFSICIGMPGIPAPLPKSSIFVSFGISTVFIIARLSKNRTFSMSIGVLRPVRLILSFHSRISSLYFINDAFCRSSKARPRCLVPSKKSEDKLPVSYTHLTLPTTPYV